MRFSEWEALSLDTGRMVFLVAGAGVGVGIAAYAGALGVLGDASAVLGMVTGAAAAYLVASEPKRALEQSAILQAREAPALAASAAVYLQSTGSRARTILMLSSSEPRLRALFERASNSTLLGVDPEESLRENDSVRSESMGVILGAVGRAQGEKLSDEGQEADSMVSGSMAREETKFPTFMTISFFMPIMMMLVAALGHHDDIVSVASLSLLEIVVLDLVLSFSSSERRRLVQ